MFSKKIIVVGGGLAGLIAAIRLARGGFECTLIEKKTYPFHRVCGEYISNETAEFLKREGLYPEAFNPPVINELELSSVSGKNICIPLPSGGFGISRYTYDSFLYAVAKAAGVMFLLNTEVESIHFENNCFQVKTSAENLTANWVVGAFGKRSRLDTHLSRAFIKNRSPFVGVKYHAKINHPDHRISLHNFKGGYCGVSNVENGITNICYLTQRSTFKNAGNIEKVEKTVLSENIHLKKIFSEADFLFQKPEVINEISFDIKEPIKNHILMIGDAAGMITPLCGNGMAMAIHSAKILSDLLIEYSDRAVVEKNYVLRWRKVFSKRLWAGKQIQNKLFGTAFGSGVAINLGIRFPAITQWMINATHGQSF